MRAGGLRSQMIGDVLGARLPQHIFMFVDNDGRFHVNKPFKNRRRYLTTGSPLNLYNNTRLIASRALTSRTPWHNPFKGWSSDFPPLPDAFSPKRTMALLSGSHNGVHCCGTVGDSHSHSQLSTAKCTFVGHTSLYCGAKVIIFCE